MTSGDYDWGRHLDRGDPRGVVTYSDRPDLGDLSTLKDGPTFKELVVTLLWFVLLLMPLIAFVLVILEVLG